MADPEEKITLTLGGEPFVVRDDRAPEPWAVAVAAGIVSFAIAAAILVGSMI